MESSDYFFPQYYLCTSRSRWSQLKADRVHAGAITVLLNEPLEQVEPMIVLDGAADITTGELDIITAGSLLFKEATLLRSLRPTTIMILTLSSRAVHCMA